MKHSNHFLLLSTLFLAISLSSAQQLNISQEYIFPANPPTWTSNGYYFFTFIDMGYVYNISTGQTWTIQELISVCKGNNYIITSSGEYFCSFYTGYSMNWYQFSPNNFKILDEIEYATLKTFYGNVESDNYITYINGQDLSKVWSAVTYNTETKKYSCGVTFQNQDFQFNTDYIVSGYLYPAFMLNGNVFWFPCNGDSPVPTKLSSLAADIYENGFVSLNQSTVYIGSGVNSGNLYSQAALVDLAGTIATGPIYPYDAIKYNDTHFVSTYPLKGFWMVGILTVGPNLNYIPILQVNTTITSAFANFAGTASPIGGSDTEVMITLSDFSSCIVNIGQGEIVATFPDYPPFQLNNGSWVNLTEFGYFIQSPGEPIYFSQAPYTTIYVDPNMNDIWTLYLPNKVNLEDGYTLCTLTHYQKNISQISQLNYNSCPLLNAAGVLGDVSIDIDGNPMTTVVYRGIYLISVSEYTEVLSINTNSEIQVSMNFSSGVGVFAYSTATEFKVSQFNISSSNSHIFNTTSIPLITGEYTAYSIQKVTGNYFLLATGNTTNSAYTVWDGLNQVVVTKVKSNMTFVNIVREGIRYKTVQYPVLGIVGQNSSNVVDQIVWGNAAVFYVYSGEGSAEEYAMPDEEVLNIVQLDNGNFWISSTTGFSKAWWQFDILM